jgi:tRNA pseudouridine13 synthase
LDSPHYITSDLPPLGGRIKERAEDFLVDEQPLYQPSGSGEHIYLFVEKRELSTLRAARILAAHFGVHVSAVGYAGLKDKAAITRQHFSVHVPGKRAEDFPMLQHERMGVLWVDQHTNKLRRGHLTGNRFSIRIRGVPVSAVVTARRVIERLAERGVPNFVGQQRFGYTGRNHLVGRGLLMGDAKAVLDALLAPVEGISDTQHEGRVLYGRGEYEGALHAFFRESRTERRVLGVLSRGGGAAKAVRAIEREEELFYLSAFQSDVFNRVLAERLARGWFDELRIGDVAFRHVNRSVFDVTAENLDEAMRARLAAFEISPSGPMWGARMKRAGAGAGEIDEMEIEALEATGVTIEQLRAYDNRRPHRIAGERRALRIRLTDPDVEGGVDEHGSYVRLAFDLPRGGFATAVLREVMKGKVTEGHISGTEPE